MESRRNGPQLSSRHDDDDDDDKECAKRSSPYVDGLQLAAETDCLKIWRCVCF